MKHLATSSHAIPLLQLAGGCEVVTAAALLPGCCFEENQSDEVSTASKRPTCKVALRREVRRQHHRRVPCAGAHAQRVARLRPQGRHCGEVQHRERRFVKCLRRCSWLSHAPRRQPRRRRCRPCARSRCSRILWPADPPLRALMLRSICVSPCVSASQLAEDNLSEEARPLLDGHGGAAVGIPQPQRESLRGLHLRPVRPV